MAISTDITPAYRVEAFAFDLYLGFFRALGLDLGSKVGGGLLQAIGQFGSPNRTAMRNLRMAFPNETEAWRRDVARACWDEIGRTAAELVHLPKLDPFSDDGRVELVGLEKLHAIRDSGRGVVFISGHFSNWELMPMTIAKAGAPCAMTYRPANNPIIDTRILDIRKSYGANLQSAKGVEGGVGLMRALAKKQSVALMNDQKYNEGIAAPLFGYDCMTADGPTRIAMRFKTDLVPMSVKRLKGARFRVTCYDPLPLDHDAPPETEIPASVARINQFMEARIREAPEQWFWVHQRWPKEAWAKAGVL
ncbi:MAG: lysophospholipid acyltransferase family protein [Caulobacterales bacterium]